MRVLHVTPFYEPAWAFGGMARCSSGLCRALARGGHDVTVVTARLDPAHPEEETLGGVRVVRFDGPRVLARYLVPWGRGLGGFLARDAPSTDIAHFHGLRSSIAVTAARALGRLGVPWVLLPNGTFPHHGQRVLAKRVFDRLAGDRIVRGARALIAVSEAEVRDLPRPAVIVPNGVEMEDAPRPPRAAEARLLFVGSERPQKRARVLPALLGALPGATLDAVGPLGAGFGRTFGAAARRVTVHGVLNGAALARAYAAADLVVHPAVGEGFGLVPFEAALLGTAAVVAGGHGCGEWFGRAGGCVVPPEDADALLAAVSTRLSDPSLAAAEAGRVAAFARTHLTWDHVAESVLGVYALVLDSSRKGVA